MHRWWNGLTGHFDQNGVWDKIVNVAFDPFTLEGLQLAQHSGDGCAKEICRISRKPVGFQALALLCAAAIGRRFEEIDGRRTGTDGPVVRLLLSWTVGGALAAFVTRRVPFSFDRSQADRPRSAGDGNGRRHDVIRHAAEKLPHESAVERIPHQRFTWRIRCIRRIQPIPELVRRTFPGRTCLLWDPVDSCSHWHPVG